MERSRRSPSASGGPGRPANAAWPRSRPPLSCSRPGRRWSAGRHIRARCSGSTPRVPAGGLRWPRTHLRGCAPGRPAAWVGPQGPPGPRVVTFTPAGVAQPRTRLPPRSTARLGPSSEYESKLHSAVSSQMPAGDRLAALMSVPLSDLVIQATVRRPSGPISTSACSDPVASGCGALQHWVDPVGHDQVGASFEEGLPHDCRHVAARQRTGEQHVRSTRAVGCSTSQGDRWPPLGSRVGRGDHGAPA